MKIEPNMHVRTKDGDMFILDKIEDNHLIPRYVHIPYIITEEDVFKTSHNIIDLIEVGDYVNGCKVHRIANCITIILDNEEHISWVRPCDIKSIVTKEQFSQMEQKIGDDKY